MNNIIIKTSEFGYCTGSILSTTELLTDSGPFRQAPTYVEDMARRTPSTTPFPETPPFPENNLQPGHVMSHGRHHVTVHIPGRPIKSQYRETNHVAAFTESQGMNLFTSFYDYRFHGISVGILLNVLFINITFNIFF